MMSLSDAIGKTFIVSMLCLPQNAPEKRSGRPGKKEPQQARKNFPYAERIAEQLEISGIEGRVARYPGSF
jgi:hypothetical protein